MHDCWKKLYTVGHSNLEPDPFVKLLKRAEVVAVVDVRSVPQSSRFPHFTQPVLEKLLEAQGIGYVFLGEELGGRPDDPDAYREDGRVDYRARRRSYAFRAGLDRVLKLAQDKTLALLCAEEDPLDCHRFLMICPELVAAGLSPLHIRKGAQVETQEETENRLLNAHGFAGVAAHTLFPQARVEALEKAYDLQTLKAAFQVDPMMLQRW